MFFPSTCVLSICLIRFQNGNIFQKNAHLTSATIHTPLPPLVIGIDGLRGEWSHNAQLQRGIFMHMFLCTLQALRWPFATWTPRATSTSQTCRPLWTILTSASIGPNECSKPLSNQDEGFLFLSVINGLREILRNYIIPDPQNLTNVLKTFILVLCYLI